MIRVLLAESMFSPASFYRYLAFGAETIHSLPLSQHQMIHKDSLRSKSGGFLYHIVLSVDKTRPILFNSLWSDFIECKALFPDISR